MKALTFLEWYFKSFQTTEIYKLRDVANFYNQPFTVDMLVNPHQINAVECVSQDDPCIMEWVKYESLRLFEGWDSSIYKIKQNYISDYKGIIDEKYPYKLLQFGVYVMRFKTLNDFITLCNLAGIELQFNKSNETIKKLFGEVKK